MDLVPNKMTRENEFLIENGSLYLKTAPHFGGSITDFSFIHSGSVVEIFRRMKDEDFLIGNVERSACFPLVPYVGRIKDAEFSWKGKSYKVKKFSHENNAVHGEGWENPWKVINHKKNYIELSFISPQLGYPFAYEAYQSFELTENKLIITLSVKNLENFAIPVGLGIHPWFNSGNPILKFSANYIWLLNSDNLFEKVVPVSPELDFSQGRNLLETPLATSFSNWNGIASLNTTEFTLEIDSTKELRHILLYTTDPTGDYCVEPISHSVDGFNLYDQGMEGTGIFELPPKEVVSGQITFSVKT